MKCLQNFYFCSPYKLPQNRHGSSKWRKLQREEDEKQGDTLLRVRVL